MPDLFDLQIVLHISLDESRTGSVEKSFLQLFHFHIVMVPTCLPLTSTLLKQPLHGINFPVSFSRCILSEKAHMSYYAVFIAEDREKMKSIPVSTMR